MAYNTLIQQGYFTSDGTDKIIPLRSDVDWVEVHNLTNIAASTQWDSVTWYWQRGMDNDDSILDFHAAATQVISRSTSAIGFNGVVYRGISLIDSTDKTPGAPIAVTAGTNATQPVYSTGNTGTLATGNIVRIESSAHTNLNGKDFSIDTIVANTSFRLANTLSQAPGAIAGANGYWRYVAPNVTVYNMFNPRKRNIANITAANPGVVTTLVDHGFVTGQMVRMKVPNDSGMSELNDVLVTVTRINASTFSIGVDTSAYTAFDYLTIGDLLLGTNRFAEVIPVGVDPTNNTSLDDAQENTGFIGIILGTSATAGIAAGSPGGSNGDVIKWRAGKSFGI